jgi:hypothetical protein
LRQRCFSIAVKAICHEALVFVPGLLEIYSLHAPSVNPLDYPMPEALTSLAQ